MHYIDEGSGPVIVMVHGNPTWSYYFRHLITLLRSKYRVIALDHIGCGLSEKPQKYSYCLAQHIENMEQLLTHLHIDRFSLVVHDWGGAIGIGCAVNHISSVDKIVVMNTAAFRSSRIPLRIRLCRLPLAGEVIVRMLNGFAWPAQFMAVKKKLAATVAKAYLAPYNNWQNRVAVYNFVRDIPLDAQHPSYATLVDIEKKLPLLRAHAVSLLIVWGGGDFCFNDHFFKEWRTRFPEAEYHYFPDGGHYILEDKREEIVPLLTSFFRV
ncbi:alpha/beta fold hydrolase [Desulfopila sp. IMCC35006]|nr:alpha/beta fold hydrolase [Desulfopila sp. IMCC35006]